MFPEVNQLIGMARKYQDRDRPPYYTTYPTGGEWSNTFSPQDYARALRDQCPPQGEVPVALYVHFPFCPKLCHFCLCVVRITSNRQAIREYLDHLDREIGLLRDFFKRHSLVPKVREIHLGGGSPSFMEEAEFEKLVRKLGSFADIAHLDEFTLEIDPRNLDENRDRMKFYHEMGVNRISFGIQDFDPKVQEAVNRVQSLELIEALVGPEIRRCSVNFDLIYGFPFQTRESFRETLRTTLRLAPNRLSVYDYDHAPHVYKHQGLLNPADMPGQDEKTQIGHDTVSTLLENGYEWVGIDHFAKREDKLSQSHRKGTLWRNPNGYTTDRTYHFEIGLGMSSIGGFGDTYAQNIKHLPDYYRAVTAGEFPVFRGCRLNEDDVVRRDVIFSLVCRQSIDVRNVASRYGIDFWTYFARERDGLKDLARDGMIEISQEAVWVTTLGRFFIPHIARVFDRYLQEGKEYIRTHDAIQRARRARPGLGTAG